MNVLDVVNVKKAFGSRQAVDGVSLSISEGEIFGLLGPNGAGKTTTLSLISGLLRPHTGTITIGGWNVVTQATKAKALLGVVPQEPALYSQLSAEANLRFWGTMNGLQTADLTNAVKHALTVVGLTDRAQERVAKYSGGMKRRLNIAAGIIHNPKLLIMDEPTVGVDPQSRNHILQTVKNLREQGTAIIYTSHYVEEVEDLCDRVTVMDQGKVISAGTVSQLLNKAGQYQELVITVNGTKATSLMQLTALPGIKEIFTINNVYKILTSNAEQVLPLTYETILAEGMQVSAIHIHKPSLESLFLKLTGRTLRDQ
ncbi:MAG: ABC transporter ATP-binding protein [Firmicutes bacterium]|nr:ABC transporter ATP-binding protein [Bacillota bacterium]